VFHLISYKDHELLKYIVSELPADIKEVPADFILLAKHSHYLDSDEIKYDLIRKKYSL
jgi:hypothetical protein